MKNSCIKLVLILLFVGSASNVLATGPYQAKIKTLQATSIGNSLNTVHLDMDVTDSPCSSTNANDRFTITSQAQLSVILAALMADKAIRIYGTGVCGGTNNESISDVRLSP